MKRTLALVVLLLGAAACGGGGEDRLSEEDFREQANAICADYEDRLSAIGTPESPEDIPGYVEQAIPLLEEGVAKLRALNPPEELEEDYDAMLDETAKAIPAARDLSEAAADLDAAAVQQAIAAGQRAERASDRLAASLGLDSCATGE